MRASQESDSCKSGGGLTPGCSFAQKVFLLVRASGRCIDRTPVYYVSGLYTANADWALSIFVLPLRSALAARARVKYRAECHGGASLFAVL